MLFFLDFSQESMNGFNNALGGFLPPTTNLTPSLSNPASEYQNSLSENVHFYLRSFTLLSSKKIFFSGNPFPNQNMTNMPMNIPQNSSISQPASLPFSNSMDISALEKKPDLTKMDSIASFTEPGSIDTRFDTFQLGKNF